MKGVDNFSLLLVSPSGHLVQHLSCTELFLTDINNLVAGSGALSVTCLLDLLQWLRASFPWSMRLILPALLRSPFFVCHLNVSVPVLCPSPYCTFHPLKQVASTLQLSQILSPAISLNLADCLRDIFIWISHRQLKINI